MQCGKCEHEWLRENPDRISCDAPSLAPDMRDLVDDRSNMIETNLPIAVSDTSNAVVENGHDSAPIYVDREADIAEKKKANYLPIAGLASICLMLGTIVFQSQVIDTFPQAQSAYESAGLKSPVKELAISNIETVESEKDGIKRLIIRGEIENMAAHQVPVPLIELTMRGEQKVGLYAWTVSASKNALKAGERSRFTAIAEDYPGKAVDVEVKFATPPDKKR